MSALAKLQEVVDGTFHGGSVDVARFLLGAAALLQALDSAPVLTALAAPGALRTPMFAWLPVLPLPGIQALLLIWVVVALCFAVGLRTRLAGCVLSSILLYSILMDQQSYSNHVYLMVIVTPLIAFAGAGYGISMDVLRGRRPPGINRLPVELVKMQLSIVYLFAAISKLNVVYMSGVIIAANLRHSWLLPIPAEWIRWEAMFVLATMSIAVELFLAAGFWLRRYRKAACFAGVALHVSILALYPASSLLPLTVFALVMLAMYAQFFDLDARVWEHRFLRRVRPDVIALPPMPGGQPTS